MWNNNGTQHGLYASRAIEYIFSAVVILTEHLYFGRALKSYGQGRAAEHQFPAGAKPEPLAAIFAIKIVLYGLFST